MTSTRAAERWFSGNCLWFLILALILGCGRSEREFDSTPPWKSDTAHGAPFYAELEGEVIVLLPVRATLSVPEQWITRHLEGEATLHLSRRAIDLTAEQEGAFNKEYMSICNALFPIDRCALHAGDSKSFQSPQIRVYVLDQSVEDVEKLIARKAAQEVTRITGHDPEVRSSATDDWRQYAVSFFRFQVDFGRTATIDVRFREYNSKTVAFVCMYDDDATHEETIARILASFAWPSEK